jgi:DNA-binding transcriptional LysR family regulator
MASANPRLRVRAALGDFDALARQVLAGDIEFAIAETAAAERHPKQLLIEPLAEHRMFFFARAGHPLAVDRHPTLESILEFPLVGTRMPPRVAVHIARLKPRASVERETGDGLPNLAVGSLSVSKSVVLSGDAVGFGPLGALAAELRAGKLALLRFDAPWLRLSYGLFHARRRPLSRVAQLLLIQLRQVEDDIEAQGRRALARLEKPRPARAAKTAAKRKPARKGARRKARATAR